MLLGMKGLSYKDNLGFVLLERWGREFKTRGHTFKVKGERFKKDVRGNLFHIVAHVLNELPEEVVDSHVTLETNNAATTSGNDACTIQAEMLQLDLIDAVDDIEEEDNGPLKESKPDSMASYKPKRPTTLNLFPQVPRTQPEHISSNKEIQTAHRTP
eukprot:g46040.t1